MIRAAGEVFEPVFPGEAGICFRSMLGTIVRSDYFWDAMASEYGAGVFDHCFGCELVQTSNFDPS